jgi:hypothetical protein
MGMKLPKKPARISGVVLRLGLTLTFVWIGLYLLYGAVAFSRFGFEVVAGLIVLMVLPTSMHQYLLRRRLARNRTSAK